MTLTTPTRPRITERQSLVAELTRLRLRLALVTGNGQDNFGAVCAMLTTSNVSVTPRTPTAVRGSFPGVVWGDVAAAHGAWVTVTAVLPELLDELLADGVL